MSNLEEQPIGTYIIIQNSRYPLIRKAADDGWLFYIRAGSASGTVWLPTDVLQVWLEAELHSFS